jgi:hypothetical protein
MMKDERFYCLVTLKILSTGGAYVGPSPRRRPPYYASLLCRCHDKPVALLDQVDIVSEDGKYFVKKGP